MADDPNIQPESVVVFNSLSRGPAEGPFGLHHFMFNQLVEQHAKKSMFGGTKITFGNIVQFLVMICDWGSYMATRSSAASIELVKWSLRKGDGSTETVLEAAVDSVAARFALFKLQYGEDPQDSTHLHAFTTYLRYGFDPWSSGKEAGKAAKRKLGTSMEVLFPFEFQAGLSINEGIVIAREYPDFYARPLKKDVPSDGEEGRHQRYNHVYQSARQWSEMFRPDLTDLFD